jgi:hypothetical protein
MRVRKKTHTTLFVVEIRPWFAFDFNDDDNQQHEYLLPEQPWLS